MQEVTAGVLWTATPVTKSCSVSLPLYSGGLQKALRKAMPFP